MALATAANAAGSLTSMSTTASPRSTRRPVAVQRLCRRLQRLISSASTVTSGQPFMKVRLSRFGIGL